MEFYRAEILVENLKKHNEEENKQRKKEEERHGEDMNAQSNAAKMMADAKRSMPSFKIPTNLGKFSF